MAIELTGGCRVSLLREGAPERHGDVSEWPRIGRATGADAMSLRTLQLDGRATLGGAACDEVLYVLDGDGTLNGSQLARDTGFYLPPGVTVGVEGNLTLLSSRCPEPEGAAVSADGGPTVVRLEDCLSETTEDRWYRVLLDHKIGESRVTQFVGAIPPGRAPDHFHEYEEVLCILSGTGRMWGGDKSTPIERGSCIYLPRRQMHCVENTGDTELRLLGVFYPSGSPAVRYSR